MSAPEPAPAPLTVPATVVDPASVLDPVSAHRHGRRCYWDLRVARWVCSAPAGQTDRHG